MNIGKMTKNRIGYILNKLAALGLLVFIMCFYIILETEFDLYDFTESISNLRYWGLICGYALMTTLLIDLIRYKWIRFTYKTSILLHCFAGFIAFFPFMGFNIFSLIAGFIGALCAVIYAFSYILIKKKKQLVWVSLFIFPLLLCIRFFDFTEKEGWKEEKTKSSFYAEFEHFNGKSEIPISLKKGDVVTIYISFDQMNEGGYGYHILNNNGQLAGMKELDGTYEEYRDIDTNIIQFNAEKTDEYRLIVKGDNLKGTIDIKWQID